MFGQLPVLALLATTAFASPFVKRADGLDVKITSPGDSLKSVDGLKFTAEVTNNGKEDVRVLKYGTVLDSLPTKSFGVSKDGKKVDFSGVKLNVDHKNDGAFQTIKAGETVKVDHDLSTLYNFASVGTGKFDFTPNTNFRGASSSKVAANKETDTISINITDDVNKRELSFLNKRASGSVTRRKLDGRSTVACDDSTKSDFISSSYKEGKELASLGSDYVSDGGSLVKDYFSSNSDSAVSKILDTVADEDDSDRTLNCSDEANACEQGVIAYTIVSTTDIYYCDIFYDEVKTTELCSGTSVADRNIRGGTTLHEMTHATSGTEDVTYGCSDNQALSASEQIDNADNFNCFTTAVYAATKC